MIIFWFFFFLSAKMNSWKITESSVKKNEHLLLKFLMSSVVFRAYVTAVGRYWGWWDLSVSCAVVTGIVDRVCSLYSDGWIVDLVTKTCQDVFPKCFIESHLPLAVVLVIVCSEKTFAGLRWDGRCLLSWFPAHSGLDMFVKVCALPH